MVCRVYVSVPPEWTGWQLLSSLESTSASLDKKFSGGREFVIDFVMRLSMGMRVDIIVLVVEDRGVVREVGRVKS